MKLNSRRKKFGVIGGVVILFLIIFLPVYFLVLSDSNDDTISNGELYFQRFRKATECTLKNTGNSWSVRTNRCSPTGPIFFTISNFTIFLIFTESWSQQFELLIPLISVGSFSPKIFLGSHFQ